MSKTEPQLDDFENLGLIGEGSIASCFAVRHKETGEVLCLKSFSYGKNSDDLVRVKTIIPVLEAVMDVPFVAKPYRAFATNKNAIILNEFIPGGEVFIHAARNVRIRSISIPVKSC
jgi:hypothetical protein